MTTLPEGFHHLHLELAREPGHPDGDSHHGYDLVVPLTLDGHLDAAAWRADPHLCHVRRFRPNQDDAIGQLARRPGGQWYIDYGRGSADDEPGLRFNDERFVPGEYVSIREDDGELHVFKVALVRPL